jgi:serine/threonine protein kinase
MAIMNVCLNHELLKSYVSGSCSHEEHRVISAHLAECQSCRQQVESVRRNAPTLNPADLKRAADENIAEGSGNKTMKCTECSEDHPTLVLPAVKTRASIEIEGYEILSTLPLGGQAVVYKGIQGATKRVVALKVLLRGPHASARAQYRFEREVDLAASLQHSNIVTIYDSGVSKGQHYFAMQYIEGKPLDKYVRSEELSVRRIMELFDRVCSAVAYAHQRGVIHRDLKPGNILVDAEGEPHILDFGLAKLVDGFEQTSQDKVMTSIPGQVIGTLAFMSPEQALAQPDSIDVRTDVYSIGVILYKVLTGALPYDVSGSMLAVLRNIQEVEPTRPSSLVRGFNSEAEAILLKALAKDPARRYQSAAHLQQDIENWLKGLPIAAKANSSLYLLRKIIVRHYYASAVVAMLLIIVFGFSCFYYQLHGRLRRANTTLESTVQSLHQETAFYSKLALKVSFADFLETLHAGQYRQSQFIAGHFVQGTREMKGARFLLDRAPMADKIAQFRQSLAESEPFFTEFVIAEHHLKDGNSADAVGVYQNCLSSDVTSEKDRWLATLVKSRLYELADKGRRGKASVMVGD